MCTTSMWCILNAAEERRYDYIIPDRCAIIEPLYGQSNVENQATAGDCPLLPFEYMQTPHMEGFLKLTTFDLESRASLRTSVMSRMGVWQLDDIHSIWRKIERSVASALRPRGYLSNTGQYRSTPRSGIVCTSPLRCSSMLPGTYSAGLSCCPAEMQRILVAAFSLRRCGSKWPNCVFVHWLIGLVAYDWQLYGCSLSARHT